MVDSPAPLNRPLDEFDELVEPILFGGSDAHTSPVLTLALSSSASGRTRATNRAGAGGVVLNARDLEILATHLYRSESSYPSRIAAEWLQRGLTLARTRRTSVTVEGTFRSPDFVTGVAAVFAESGYEARVIAVAERESEVQMADASRRFDALRQAGQVEARDSGNLFSPIPPLLEATSASPAIGRVTIFDRTGGVVVDSSRDDAEYATTAVAFADAAARPLGALRSALWLSELRHMTRFLAQQRSAPRWAVDDLIVLHEAALEEIVPELPIPADSDAYRLQVARLAATLSTLRDSVSPELPDGGMGPVAVPSADGPGLMR